MATLQSIAVKTTKRGPMQRVVFRDIGLENGLDGDCRGKGGFMRKRQITVISCEQWEETCREIGVSLPIETRRANLSIKGITFGPESKGRRLEIGSYVVLEITGETTPCSRMEEAHRGLEAVLAKNWRGGVTCRVITEGAIMVGHEVKLL